MNGRIVVGLLSIVNKSFSDVDIVVQERLDTVEISFNVIFDKLPSTEIFNKITENVPKRDSLKIILVNDSDDLMTITSDCIDAAKYSEFVE